MINPLFNAPPPAVPISIPVEKPVSTSAKSTPEDHFVASEKKADKFQDMSAAVKEFAGKGKEENRAEPVKITIISTNDMHGKLDLMPKVAAVIKDLQAKNPDAVLVDGGDSSYNPPYSTSNKFMPVTDVLNTIDYDIINLGNHEFQDNKDATIKTFISQVADDNTDVLAANVHYDKNKDLPGTSQYVIKEMDGVKVAFVGLVEPNMGTKPNPQVGADLTKESTTEAMKRLMPELKEKADVIIAMSHQGINDDQRMLSQVKGIDLVLASHDHAVTDAPISVGSYPNQSYIVEGGSHCKLVSLTELTIDPTSKEVLDINFKNYPVQSYNVKPDPNVTEVINNYRPKGYL